MNSSTYDPHKALDEGYKYHKQAWLDSQVSCLIAQGHVPKCDTVQILSDTYDSIVEKGAEMKGVTRSNVVEIASK